MHVPQFKYFALFFRFRRKELLQLLQFSGIHFLRSLFSNYLANLHHRYITFVISCKGTLRVLFEKRNRQVILSQQKVALRLGQHQLVVSLHLDTVAEGRQTVFVGTVLKEEVPSILMDVLIFGSKSNVSLQIEESLVGVPLDLQAFGPFQIRLGVFFVEVDGDSEVLDCLTEVSEDGESESS